MIDDLQYAPNREYVDAAAGTTDQPAPTDGRPEPWYKQYLDDLKKKELGAGIHHLAGLAMMADGGAVAGPTLALIGEGGEPEYVVPESKVPQFVQHTMRTGRPPNPAKLPPMAAGGGGQATGIEELPPNEKTYKLGSTQFNLPEEIAQAVAQMAGQIDDDDLAESGRETEPHITVKYGLKSDDPKAILKALAGIGPIEATLGKTSTFPPGDDGEPLKADVDSPGLHELNAAIAGCVDCEDTHPDYNPHVTIAYLKPGTGSKYEGDDSLAGKKVNVDHVVFSGRDGKRFKIPLGAPTPAMANGGKVAPHVRNIPKVPRPKVPHMADGGMVLPQYGPPKPFTLPPNPANPYAQPDLAMDAPPDLPVDSMAPTFPGGMPQLQRPTRPIPPRITSAADKYAAVLKAAPKPKWYDALMAQPNQTHYGTGKVESYGALGAGIRNTIGSLLPFNRKLQEHAQELEAAKAAVGTEKQANADAREETQLQAQMELNRARLGSEEKQQALYEKQAAKLDQPEKVKPSEHEQKLQFLRDNFPEATDEIRHQFLLGIKPEKQDKPPKKSVAEIDLDDAMSLHASKIGKPVEQFTAADRAAARKEFDRATKPDKDTGRPGEDMGALTKQGLDIAAELFATTGQLPAVGQGKNAASTRAAIINRAAEMHPDLDVAGNKADYGADKASLTKLQQNIDAVNAFETTGRKNIQQFVDAGKKVTDTGIPLLNAPIRAAQKAFGNKDVPAYQAARKVALNEAAKILTNPGLSGVISDSARHEVEGLLSGDASDDQVNSVLQVLLNDMDNRKGAMSEQLAEIKSRRRGAAPAGGDAKAGGGKISVKAPDGSMHDFDTQAQADAFKALIAGAKK